MTPKRAIPFRGMMPILPTTIRPDGAIDEAGQRSLVRYAIESGAVAIGHFGFASEFHKLTPADRRLVTKVVVDEIGGRVPLFLGVTGVSARQAAELAREAADAGADLLMVATPYVNLPTQAELFDYFAQVSAAAPSCPIIIQDTPPAAGLLTVDFCVRLFDEIESVLYCKAEGGDFISKGRRLHERTDGRMHVIGGFGGKHMLHALRLGVTSFMTGTEWLDLHGGIVRDFLAGEIESARRAYYERLLPYFVWYDAYPEQLLKYMLKRRGIIEHADVIAPRSQRPMPSEEFAEFEWVLEQVGFDDERVAPSPPYPGERVGVRG